jgi:serine/threonine-protein kinase
MTPEPLAINLSNSPTLSAAATQQGIILGTAAYMSPEQARGKSVDRRADIWSFGVVFFEMLTGGRLFGGEDITDTLARVIQAQPNLDDVPREVRRLLRKALEKDPKHRLRDIGDAWELLDEPSPEFERLAPTNARSLARIAAAALAFIAAALGFGWWRAAQAVEQPLVQLGLELGEDVSLPALATSNAIAISADGTRLAYVSGTPAKLFVRKLNQRKATELPGTENARAPFFSPDGQWLGFISRGGDKINKISVEGGAVVPLAADSQGLTRGAWGEDGNIYVGRTSIALHDPAIVRIPSGGGTSTTVLESTTELQNHILEQILPGGKAIMFVSFPANDPQATSIQILTLSDHKTKTIAPGASRPKYVPSGHLIYASRGALFAVPFDLDRLELRGTPTRILDDLAYNRATLRSDFDVTAVPEGHGTLIYRSGG